MKKLLYSSAVLIASCGIAAAQVSVGGAAKVGIKYTDADNMGMSIFHDVDLTLALSGQTDGGLSFGAEMTIDNDQGVGVTVTSMTSTVSTKMTPEDMNTDTDTRLSMIPTATGVTYTDGMGRRLYSKSTNGADEVITYHTSVLGSEFMHTPSTSTTFGTFALIATDGESQGAKAMFVPTTGGKEAIHLWTTADDGVLMEVSEGVYLQHADAATNYQIITKVDGKWTITNSVTADALPTSPADITVGQGTTAAPAKLMHFLDEIDYSINTMYAASEIVETDPQTSESIELSDTNSVESATASLNDDSSVFISGGFGKISVGAVDAGDVMASGIADIGFDGIGVDNMAEGLRGGTTPDFLYEFSAGGVSFGLSADSKGDNSALGIKYSLDPISVGLGYANLDGGDNVLSIGVGASLGGVSTNVMYSTQKTGGTATGMDASFAAADNMTVTIAAASKKDGMGMSESAYGLGLSFDLGGGATLGTGVGTVSGDTKAELGLSLTF